MENNRFVAFDVETPNARNDRMSAIGLVVIEDGEITDRIYTLVNPETSFDSFNISLTGITPRMAAKSPTFPLVWELLRSRMSRGVLVAHNAPFDLGVLGRCLRDYGIDWQNYGQYVCTCQIGRRLLPQLPNHRLDTMAGYYAISLQHHNALSDALACAELLRRYQQTGTDLTQFLRTYDWKGLCTVRPSDCTV